ncbi:MAG: dihydropteroate synthase [Treponema lecithinolyticum]|uniref:dihydropteroate synthase n=1 Tax=Treponema lecithinolyticum TaxID=53418 RepID=UPI003FA1FA2C
MAEIMNTANSIYGQSLQDTKSFSPLPLVLADRTITTKRSAYVMSIVNCTPDSFWKDSRCFETHKAAERVLEHFEQGADIVDIGGESTRPHSVYVSEDEQIQRVVPVIEEVRRHSNGVLSVDTRTRAVMQAARQAGADILNDVAALEDDKTLAQWAAKENIPVVLMHKRGIPLVMQNNTCYTDAVQDIALYLAKRVQYAIEQGIASDKIIIDPGIGFAKDVQANLNLVKAGAFFLNAVKKHCRISIAHALIGVSRKSFIGEITGKDVERRLAGTLAVSFAAVQNGYTILRAHDTAEMVDMLQVLDALRRTQTPTIEE